MALGTDKNDILAGMSVAEKPGESAYDRQLLTPLKLARTKLIM